MADNTQLNAMAGGDLLKTEDVGGYKLAVGKIYLGAHGVDGGPVGPGNPLPVTVGNLPATQPVSGTVAISNLPATQPVSGTVSVGNFPATQPVSGSVTVSNFPATQPVSGSVVAGDQTGALYSGSTALTPKYRAIVASASGITQVVAAVAGKKIRVLRWFLSARRPSTPSGRATPGRPRPT